MIYYVFIIFCPVLFDFMPSKIKSDTVNKQTLFSIKIKIALSHIRGLGCENSLHVHDCSRSDIFSILKTKATSSFNL